ncbi:aspartyl protease AED3-like [Vicia villosa]|uniref:aspartyl protease AED3-like n=1 Tax=Vicia villosa TaxID=3911 RepID=UPI00273C859C|nr:aspartyl protease AED3-like [Vicia villosa]
MQNQFINNLKSTTMNLKLVITLTICYVIYICKSNAIDPCASQPDNSDLNVIPMYGKCSPFNPPKTDSWDNRIINMASKDPARMSYLSTLVAQKTASSTPIASGQAFNIGNYVVRVKIGTPGQLLFMVLDTSTDEAFVPSSGCTGCSASASTFSPNSSTSYVPLDCSVPQCGQVRGLSCPATSSGACLFNQSYAGSSFSATLVQDSLRLAKDVISNYSFGSINAISGASIPAQGLLGLGRGPLSLLSQSGSIYSGVFSYCLPSFKSSYFSGSLKLGPVGQPKSIRTTPLLRNPHRPSLYYVNFTGISVGRVNVPLPNEHLSFDPNTGSGTIIDSGTVITRFVEPIYNAVRDEFRKQVTGPFSNLGAFDTCFVKTYETLAPAVTLHFTGLDLKLPMENSLIHSSSGSLACLAMAAAPSNVNSVLNVIANFQQQNLRVLFDTVNSKVGIAREVCN